MRGFSIWGIFLGILITTSVASAASVTLYLGDKTCTNTYTLKHETKIQSTEADPYLWSCELTSKANVTKCSGISLLTTESIGEGLFDHEPSGESSFSLKSRDSDTYFLIDLKTKEYRYHSLSRGLQKRILISKSCYGKLMDEKTFKETMKIRKKSKPIILCK